MDDNNTNDQDLLHLHLLIVNDVFGDNHVEVIAYPCCQKG